MGKNKDLSLSSQGIRYKLKISLCLMSVLPLLVCLYLVSKYVFPRVGVRFDIVVAIGVSIFIAIIGFLILKEVFNRVLSISSEVKLIAQGDITRVVDTTYTDEVGDLGEAINQLTTRIRSSMAELSSYGEKTTEINLEIQRRVQTLSTLLQISSLITQGGKFNDILKVIIEKSRFLASSDTAFLLLREEGRESFSMKIADGIDAEDLYKIRIEGYEPIFNRLTKINKPFILDQENTVPENLKHEFQEKFKLTSALLMPIFLRGRATAIFGVGNYKGLSLFEKNTAELLEIFSKQVAIALENDLLLHRVEKLEIRDSLTGLFNEAFIRARLQEEIKRAIAYQRPCAFILLNIDNFQKFNQEFGALQAESVLKKVASLVKASANEIQRVARIGDHKFAIVLPENNKRLALKVAEDIRVKIEFAFSEESDKKKKITVTGSVSENPLDGIDAEELINKAESLIISAVKSQENNRIVI